MAQDRPDESPDPKRVAQDIENAAARLRKTIEPQRDDDLEPVLEQPRRGLLARLFGRG
jgi:hypothetical protein